MISDSFYKAPVDKMVKLLLQRNIKTYQYVLNSTLEGLKWTSDLRNDYLENSMYFFFFTCDFHLLSMQCIYLT